MKYTELRKAAQDTALDRAYKLWWESSYGASFRENTFENDMFNFLESTGLVDFEDFVTFVIDDPKSPRSYSTPRLRSSKGLLPSEGLMPSSLSLAARLSYKEGKSWGNEERRYEFIRYVFRNENTLQWITKFYPFRVDGYTFEESVSIVTDGYGGLDISDFDTEFIARELLEVIVFAARCCFFDWADLEDYAQDCLDESLRQDDDFSSAWEFDEKGNLLNWNR